jgi:hypothetical protein
MGLALSGCAGGSGGQMTWIRTDGRPIDAGFQAAADQCRAVAGRVGAGAPPKQREETMMAAMQRCMQQRGYAWQCEHPLGGLARSDGDSSADKEPRPIRSGLKK